MIILVCGGRDFHDLELLDATLTRVHLHSDTPIRLLIEGDCRGADRMARGWALTKGIHYATIPALWYFYGTSAGPKRNAVMLELPVDAGVAFPGGRGTADMVRKLKAKNIPVIEATAQP